MGPAAAWAGGMTGRIIPLAKRRHALYRFYDTVETPIYTGITSALGGRWGSHDHDKEWWAEVATARVEHYRTRPLALAAERKAIETEYPLYNIRHGLDIGPRQQPDDRTDVYDLGQSKALQVERYRGFVMVVVWRDTYADINRHCGDGWQVPDETLALVTSIDHHLGAWLNTKEPDQWGTSTLAGHRWYGLRVPTAYRNAARRALTVAEVASDLNPLRDLKRRLTAASGGVAA